MAVDITTLGILSDTETRSIFELVVKLKNARLDMLLKKLDTDDQASVIIHLGRLQNVGLIDEKRSTLPEWNKYFVTADGLEAIRKI